MPDNRSGGTCYAAIGRSVREESILEQTEAVRAVHVMRQLVGLLWPQCDRGGVREQAAPCMRPRQTAPLGTLGPKAAFAPLKMSVRVGSSPRRFLLKRQMTVSAYFAPSADTGRRSLRRHALQHSRPGGHILALPCRGAHPALSAAHRDSH